MLNRQSQIVAMACPYCFCTSISIDASGHWDIEKQEWVLGGTQDTMHCGNCDTEFHEASERAVNQTMLNCCTDCAEPNWDLFSNFEIAPCRADIKWDGRGGTFTETCEDFEAEFWTVYGRFKRGGVEAITDTSTVHMAWHIASRLKEISGIEGETVVFA